MNIYIYIYIWHGLIANAHIYSPFYEVFGTHVLLLLLKQKQNNLSPGAVSNKLTNWKHIMVLRHTARLV